MSGGKRRRNAALLLLAAAIVLLPLLAPQLEGASFAGADGKAQALIEIASMTFAGPEGFRMFVGNVAALVKTVNTMTSASEKTAVPPGFKRGSPAPTTSAGG